MLNQDELKTSWFCTTNTHMWLKKRKPFKRNLGNKTGEMLNTLVDVQLDSFQLFKFA